MFGACSAASDAGPAPADITVVATSLLKSPGEQRRFGQLDLLSAFELSSADRRFGGLSSLLVEGDRMTTASDGGTLFSARMELDPDGRLFGLTDWTALSFNFPTDDKEAKRRDSEAIARLADGDLAIGFERPNGLRIATPDGVIQRAIPNPPGFTATPWNQGPEAMTALADGSLLVFAEVDPDETDTVPGWIVPLDGRPAVSLRFASEPGFRPTDLSRVGDVLFVLERRFSFLGGLEARIVRVDLPAGGIRPDTVVAGRELAAIGLDDLAENYEGLAAVPDEDGSYRLFIVSDDNFAVIQRTLLLEFRYVP